MTEPNGKEEALDPNKAKQRWEGVYSVDRPSLSYLITWLSPFPPPTMIATDELESAIRTAIPVSHLDIIDQSSGCGENYAILVVSEVRYIHIIPRNTYLLQLNKGI